MKILLHLPSQDLFNTVQDVVWLFDPEAQLNQPDQPEGELWLKVEDGNLLGMLTLGAGRPLTAEIAGDFENFADPEFRRLVRFITYRLFAAALGQKFPWGILTGIRPTKIVHRFLDQGLSQEKMMQTLVTNYCLDVTKAELLLEIALRQRDFLPLPGTKKSKVGIYVGIPFCPTRCSYCTFPAFAITRYANLVEDYMHLLLQEITAAGQALRGKGILVESIYVGGGTPTSLNVKHLAALLETINANLRSDSTLEVTVEAGRPETISGEKIELFRNMAVDRVSVNPQTMQQRTLSAIGRQHSVRDVYRAVELVRKAGIKSLNMDLILGLPGEGLEDVADTMGKIATIAPDNLTVHTLAIKKASSIKQAIASLPSEKTVSQMLLLSREKALELGLKPYYMYRQKKILANLENVGYAKPGYECIYNIQIMEERQTLLGFGVGAGTKYVNSRDFSLKAEYNPKDLLDYLRRGTELIDRKIDKISEIE